MYFSFFLSWESFNLLSLNWLFRGLPSTCIYLLSVENQINQIKSKLFNVCTGMYIYFHVIIQQATNLLFQTFPITVLKALNQYFISFHIYFDLLIATNLYSSKPVETTPIQTTSSETTGSTVREASTSVETTPKQTTTSDDPSIVIKDCLDVFNAGNTTNGIYTIKPTNWRDSFEVFCNMTDGGGWTVFQRRVDGSVDFYRNWQSYKEGFGELDHEFWLGNDKLYDLTNQGDYQLRIDMVNKDGDPYYAKFDLFRINDESDNYRLSGLGTYSGTADTDGGYFPGGYALSYHLNDAFSTFDRDNDIFSSTNCAVIFHGAWWYKYCAASNLNGNYMAADDDRSSIRWYNLPGGWNNIKYTEMKIRPV
ncbi:fibrinogen-like protein A [Apostichopus japonicus]|uniref:fibrinogen-like protein A n=1 Tax=Stichopus japonicus TaxID=307972 RepID=UPI003AB20303